MQKRPSGLVGNGDYDHVGVGVPPTPGSGAAIWHIGHLASLETVTTIMPVSASPRLLAAVLQFGTFAVELLTAVLQFGPRGPRGAPWARGSPEA